VNGKPFTVDTVNPIHPNNKHYAVLDIDNESVALVNEGFNGIAVKAGDKYDFSLFARSPEKKRGEDNGSVTGTNGEVLGEATTRRMSGEWRKLEAVITATGTAANARLEVVPQQTGRVELDMISLFPQKTFKGRKNGLRADLAQALADMKTPFRTFPGWMRGAWRWNWEHLPVGKHHWSVRGTEAATQPMGIPPVGWIRVLRVFPVL